MTRKTPLLLCLVLLAAAPFAGCKSRTDRSTGTVILSLANFTVLPIQISVATGPYQIPGVTLQNFSKDPTGVTSALQNIEIKSYSISYRRRDTGTRVPPVLVQALFALVPVNGQATLNNVPIFLTDQLANPPLSDLTRFGADQETGSRVIVLDCVITFFGETLSGDKVASNPDSFTIEVTK